MRTGDRIGQNPDTPIDKLIDVKPEVYLVLVAENLDCQHSHVVIKLTINVCFQDIIHNEVEKIFLKINKILKADKTVVLHCKVTFIITYKL
jgi:hypothetical protein